MIDFARQVKIKEAAQKYCKDAAWGSDKESFPELASPFIDGARWADRHANWKDGQSECPPVGEEVLICCAITNGKEVLDITGLGRYVYENGEGCWRMGTDGGIKCQPKDCLHFWWMKIPVLPYYA